LKRLLKISLIIIVSYLVVFFGVFHRGEVGKSNKELEKVVEKGKIITAALEVFKKNNGEYPLELDSLYPKYINYDVNLVYDFYYIRGGLAKAYTKEEVDGWGGYELGVQNIKQRGLSFRHKYFFVYRPSKLYPERKWVKPKKRVKDWALIIKYRRYKSKENPIIGPGV
jgi:hypothetical protein